MAKATDVLKGARRARKQFGRFIDYQREHGGQCAPIVRSIVGSRPGAKRISAADLSTLAAIHYTDGDSDGLARHAIVLELMRGAGIDRRSL